MARIFYPGIRGAFALEPWNHHLFTERQNRLCVNFMVHALNVYNDEDLWKLQCAIAHFDGYHKLYTPAVLCGRKWADTGVYDELESVPSGNLMFATGRENDPNVQNRPFNWVYKQWLNSTVDFANANWFYNAFAFNVRWYCYDWVTVSLQWWKDPNMCAELTRWWQAFGNDANFKFGMIWRATYQHDNVEPYVEGHASYIGANEQGGWINQGGIMHVPDNCVLQASRLTYLTLEQYNPATGQWVIRADASFDEFSKYETTFHTGSGTVEYYPAFNGQYLEYARNLHQLIF